MANDTLTSNNINNLNNNRKIDETIVIHYQAEEDVMPVDEENELHTRSI
jgi:hypothetical protein